MCTGMRGLAAAEVTLTGPSRDLHSGSFGGGVPNPLHAMASLLAGLHDEAGRVTLPRFYDRVLPLSDEERDLIARLPFDEKQWLAEAGRQRRRRTASRASARWSGSGPGPTAEVNGMWGGHTGAGGKTIIPRAAHAKVSFRLVADQDPADVLAAFREYVQASTPDGLQATVTAAEPGVRPSHSPIDLPAVQAGRRAMQRAFGREVLFTKEGGSGPEADLADILGQPLVFVGVGLASDRMHAPNERWTCRCCCAAPRRRRTSGRNWPPSGRTSGDLRRAPGGARAGPRHRGPGDRRGGRTRTGSTRPGRTRAPACSWFTEGQALVREDGDESSWSSSRRRRRRPGPGSCSGRTPTAWSTSG